MLFAAAPRIMEMQLILLYVIRYVYKLSCKKLRLDQWYPLLYTMLIKNKINKKGERETKQSDRRKLEARFCAIAANVDNLFNVVQ